MQESIGNAYSIPLISTGRNKVALQPGYSLLDWIRLGRSGKDLAGTGGKHLTITLEELAKHSKLDDAWISLRGKVYNITPYLNFHPGGVDELMRGTGKDGTSLFDEIHPWVNADSMLEKCFVGHLKAESSLWKKSALLSLSSSSSDRKLDKDKGMPEYSWLQTNSTVTVFVYTKWEKIKPEFVIIDHTSKDIMLTIFIREYTYLFCLELEHPITLDYKVRTYKDLGKVEVILQKEDEGIHWENLGLPLEKHSTFKPTKEMEVTYLKCEVDEVRQVTHNTKLLRIKLGQNIRMCVPLGYHIYMRRTISDMEIVRSYTTVLPSLSSKMQDNHLDEGHVTYLMIKIYPLGVFTPWIDTLKKGSIIEMSKFAGNLKDDMLNLCTHLVMYAAGTGFTPMIRLIYEIMVKDHSGNRFAKLMFFNKTENDILWREELDSLTIANKRFTVKYVLSDADSSWTGARGRISKELIEEFTPPVSSETSPFICVCGPTPFTNDTIRFCKLLGYKEERLHAFLG